MNLTQIWQAALGAIQLQTSRQDYETWLRGTALLALDGGLATVGTASAFHKEGLENRFMAPVRRSLGDVVGYPVQVRVIIANGQAGPSAISAPPADDGGGSERAVQLDLSSAMRTGMLNPKYTFSRFIVGSSNRLAHAACLAVADNPGQHYNPLFLYGGVGLGKTHLLHAIGNYVLDRDPEINVLYVSTEKFTNDLINAIRRQQTEEFRMRYRNIDVLLIDDIQFIAGKESTQEEFFHTFNTLHSAAKQIVISSDQPPKAILTLEERLRSRFEWGLIADIQPPDLETRMAILRAKGEQMNVGIPDEVIDFLAQQGAEQHPRAGGQPEPGGRLRRAARRADHRRGGHRLSGRPARQRPPPPDHPRPGDSRRQRALRGGHADHTGARPLAQYCGAAPGGHVPAARGDGVLARRYRQAARRARPHHGDVRLR